MPKSGRTDSEFKLQNTTSDSLAAATMDIADDERLKGRRHQLQDGKDNRFVRVWHRAAKKFVTIDLASKADGTKSRVKTETGRWIPVTFKTKK